MILGELCGVQVQWDSAEVNIVVRPLILLKLIHGWLGALACVGFRPALTICQR